MPFYARRRFEWKLRSRTLALGERTVLMGIVNITPDSFSDGGLFEETGPALKHGLRLLDEGADILDLGGESTRPGAVPITAEEEQMRMLPVLTAVLKARPEAIVSVDTYHASTALEAVQAGAEIINDVSGLMWDQAVAEVVAQCEAGLIVMHTRGRPQEWAELPPLRNEEVLPVVIGGLTESLGIAWGAGVNERRVVVDPGFGFGKRGAENFALHAGLEQLQELGFPVLVGSSRKRFLSADAESRGTASLASAVAAVLAGAHIVRVHDVAAARTAVGVADEILATAQSITRQMPF